MGDLSVIVCLAFDHRAPADRLDKFKGSIFQCQFVSMVMEVSGTFDLIVQASCSSLAEFTEIMENLRTPIAELVSRIETNFVGKTVESAVKEADGSALWLPCESGRQRVEASLIDKILAEGDYMRVHVGNWSCLIHCTMRRLCEQLGESHFVQLHRSALVRISFVNRLVYHERRWKAHLRDGTYVSIARSRVQQAQRLMSNESSDTEHHSSKMGAPADETRPLNELKMKLPA
jgi:hypothetical protein